jgi:hypothetical protein
VRPCSFRLERQHREEVQRVAGEVLTGGKSPEFQKRDSVGADGMDAWDHEGVTEVSARREKLGGWP